MNEPSQSGGRWFHRLPFQDGRNLWIGLGGDWRRGVAGKGEGKSARWRELVEFDENNVKMLLQFPVQRSVKKCKR